MKINTNEQYRKAQIEYEILYDLLEEIDGDDDIKTYDQIFKTIKSWVDSTANDLNEADREKAEAGKFEGV